MALGSLFVKSSHVTYSVYGKEYLHSIQNKLSCVGVYPVISFAVSYFDGEGYIQLSWHRTGSAGLSFTLTAFN